MVLIASPSASALGASALGASALGARRIAGPARSSKW
eukprot:CAMPEP_0170477592 /NCGR_PEP_ID=MMETSP0123-20130129/18816_1 /TAXON_ID=182087 /ORGANISM="Favella ehrenbergii, Strain Fehren 1" /LENGTH=36 /DNA_ID= /DNA_START= /DNA_END= /DNA_ORIENTATION=